MQAVKSGGPETTEPKEKRMTQERHANIYRLIIPNTDLPDDNDGKLNMARDYARHVTGLDEPLHWLEPHQHEPHCRLTISVPGNWRTPPGP